MRNKKGQFIKGSIGERKGCKLSKKHKEKLRVSHLGKVPWNKDKKYPQFSGENHFMFGKKHSEETRKKMSIARRKRVFSTETRKKLSKALKGRKKTPEHLAKISKALTGKKLSLEHRKKISISNLGKSTWNKGKKGTYGLRTKGKKRPETAGANSPHWRGGITPLYKMRLLTIDWKLRVKEILQRDSYRCQVCGVFNSRKNRLEIHHIVPWRISRDDEPNNLITVCKKCHCKLEKKWRTKCLD